MKKILHILTSRGFVITVLILLQFWMFLELIYRLSDIRIFYNFFIVLSYLIVIYLVNKDENPSYKLAWSIVILVLPVFGGILYLGFGGKKVPKQLRISVTRTIEKSKILLDQDQCLLQEIKEKNFLAYKQFKYITDNVGYPVYKNTDIVFCASGEEKFELMVSELKKATSFIFIEYFIIGLGTFWNSILDILVVKVKEGVDVRVMFDDAGCIGTLPKNYHLTLEELGIQCCVFNPLRPRLVIQMNNRDHRKICVIDNNVGFIGGINIADEYINEEVRFGHWKDTAIMLKGDAVWSLTMMFLQFWSFTRKVEVDYSDYRLPHDDVEGNGYIQCLSDSPTDNEEAGFNLHLNMINNAKEYIYIQTPYLVITHEMKSALMLAAKNGVDVRITCPHVPDKWYVHLVTQSNYMSLIKAGVKIYEYLPGFIHSKTFVSDDNIGIVGTINMDYRSYYMHYECGALIYGSQMIYDMKRDYMDVLQHCVEITLDDCINTPMAKQVIQSFLNIFAPLL